jgi:hypothetical protein
MGKLERTPSYSPIDESKTEYNEYTLAEFLKIFGKDYKNFYADLGKGFEEVYLFMHSDQFICRCSWTANRKYMTMKEAFDQLKPCYRKRYLANGKLFDSTKTQSE